MSEEQVEEVQPRALPIPDNDVALAEWGNEWREKYIQDPDPFLNIRQSVGKTVVITDEEGTETYRVVIVGGSIDVIFVPEEVYRPSIITNQGLQIPLTNDMAGFEVLDD